MEALLVSVSIAGTLSSCWNNNQKKEENWPKLAAAVPQLPRRDSGTPFWIKSGNPGPLILKYSDDQFPVIYKSFHKKSKRGQKELELK